MSLRIGIVAPPAIGHLNPMLALALELTRRGHAVVVFTVADGARKLAGLPLQLVTIGAECFPAGSVDATYAQLGRLSGLAGLRFTVRYFRQEQAMLHEQLPEVLRAAKLQLLLVDQLSPAAATVAERLGLPYVTIANALPVNREAAVPPYFSGWQPSPAPWARWRNQLGNALLDRLTASLWSDLQEQRQRWGLPVRRRREQLHSPLLQLAQLPRAFDFARERLAPQFHYVGPLADPSGREPLLRDAVPFPWERLDGRPLIYASLGTLQNGRPELFAAIASACAPLEAQLVISLGRPGAPLPALPGEPLVVAFAPHQQLIARSALVITHAGLNTTLTALACGVPLLAIPITNEQPGIAARIAHCGAGRALPVRQLTSQRLRAMVAEMLGDDRYRQAARRLQAEIAAAGGVARAAELIEACLANA
ncbi:MAG: nucleotide disphospho-sugar-binding domain-containing protein [Cyanobium sp.]